MSVVRILLNPLYNSAIMISICLFITLFWRIGMSDVNILLEKAVKEVSSLKSGEVFLVKDLFKGYEWNRIPRNNRLLLVFCIIDI
jgi:hypothetical protein